ncbi:MAG: dihydrofolate reductase [Gammaproteobacteria bacterium]|nr:dihydrofolate reductase [Gammaproteobacteria bacterium]
MRVNIVVALDRQGLIGRDGGLPWRLAADLRRFREITWGHPMIMGRRTHESIGRALPGRLNIVLSHTPDFQARGCVVVPTFAAALAVCCAVDEVMVVGGVSVYAAALPGARRLFLTEVDTTAVGDTRFPPFDRDDWLEVSRQAHPADESNEHGYSFVVLERPTGSLDAGGESA